MPDAPIDLRPAFNHLDHLVEEGARDARAADRLLQQVNDLRQRAQALRDATNDPQERDRVETLVRSIDAMPERFAFSHTLFTTIRRRDLHRWPLLLDQDRGLVAEDPWLARLLLGQLIDLRFGVRAAPYAPDAAVLDRFIEHLVERNVPFPARSFEVLSLVNEPDLGMAAQRHLLGWVQRLSITDPAARVLIAAEHGFALKTLETRPDSAFEAALFNAWIDQGATPHATLPATSDGDPGLDLRGRFPNGHLRIAHAKRCARPGQAVPTFDATFVPPVAWASSMAQTLHVAAYWFANLVPNVPVWGLTEAQRDVCVTLWNQKAEHHRLRTVLDTEPSATSARLARVRTRL